MTHFIDRRLNPKDKNLGNRRRFLRRVRDQIKQAVDEKVRGRSITDIDRAGRVSVPARGIGEPSFRHSARGGRREQVLPGNHSYSSGDRLRKPPTGQGGGSGRKGAQDGDGEDDFTFALSRDEFLDIFFEDLELPDLVKQSLKAVETTKPRRAGLSASGSPANLNVERTMRNSVGRRVALGRPKSAEIDALRERIFALEAIHDPTDDERQALIDTRAELDALLGRQKRVPYIDPLDVRYTHFEQESVPNTQAVMFCLMDVSASMGEREKDLAKRFFVLLHLFLTRRYDRVDLVFIRHTQVAQEVDEDTFFNARETGGTVVSTALKEMAKVIDARYPPSKWNIYAAQASDGENFSGDSEVCRQVLTDAIMPRCQYFAYVEILDEAEAPIFRNAATGTQLWQAYRAVAADFATLATKRISKPADIYPVFRELFARDKAKTHA